MTYRELLEALQSMEEKHLDMDVIAYDGESDKLCVCNDLVQAQEKLRINRDDVEVGQSFFVLIR